MTCMPARWRFHWENKRHQCKKSPACHTVSVTVGVTGTVPLSDRYSSSVPTFTSRCYTWTGGTTCYTWTLAQLDKWTRAAHCHEWVRGAQLIPGTQLWGSSRCWWCLLLHWQTARPALLCLHWHLQHILQLSRSIWREVGCVHSVTG